MKYIFYLILLILSVNTYSQKIKGNYYAKFMKSNDWTKYDSIKLSFSSNGKFTMSFNNHWNCASVTNFHRFCSGTYQIKSDTLTLSSKYSLNDFCKVSVSRVKIKQVDSILLIFKQSNQIKLLGPELYLTVDSAYLGNYRIGDSVMIHNKALMIKMSYRCLYNMDWIVKFKDENKNKNYTFELNEMVNNQNIYFYDTRFILNKDKIIMIDKFYFLDIENNEFLKLKNTGPNTL